MFGQSTGGMIAHIISTLPQASGLISSVISESGAGRLLTTSDQQILQGNLFVATIGCANASNVSSIEFCLFYNKKIKIWLGSQLSSYEIS